MVVPAWGARVRDARPDGGRADRRRCASSALLHRRVPGADVRLRHLRLLGRQRRHELALDQAADLQDLRRVGEPRRLDAAVGADPRRCSAPPSPPSGATCRRRCKANVLAVQASIAVAFCLFILLTSNPFLRLDPPPADGNGLNPDPAGPRARLPSAVPLHGLRRLLDRLLVRDRRADRGPPRRRLGALGAAVDARSPGCA